MSQAIFAKIDTYLRIAAAVYCTACGANPSSGPTQGTPLIPAATATAAGSSGMLDDAKPNVQALPPTLAAPAGAPSGPAGTPTNAAAPSSGLAAAGGAAPPAAHGGGPATVPAPAPEPTSRPGTWGSPEWNGAGKPGTPASAASMPPGTPCEMFSHVNHLPWNDRPPECSTGDYCLKWDGDPNEQFPNGPEDVIPNATMWFANAAAAFAGPIGGVAKIAIVTCKIGNQCLRFYGENNCHYDLYDPDTNKTIKPPYMGGEDLPYAIKDGHDYMNFRVRLPGSTTVYNFMDVDARAATAPFYARYCPADAARKSAAGAFDPVEGNQALGCGPDSPYHMVAALVGETRQPIPYEPPGRSEYDWTYKQDGPKDPSQSMAAMPPRP